MTPNPDYVQSTYVVTPTPAAEIDGNVTNSTLYISNASGDAGMAVESDNASISVSAASTLNISINDGSSFLPARRDTSQYTFGSATATASAAQSQASLIAPVIDRLYYVQGIQISNGADEGNLLLQEYAGATYTTVLETMYLAANGAATINLVTPLVLTVSNGLSFTSTSMTTHSLTIKYYY